MTLWLTVILVTLVIELSTFSWLPAYHAAAGMLLLRVAQVVENRITELAVELDIDVTTTIFLRRVSFWAFAGLASVSFLSSLGVETGLYTAAYYGAGLDGCQVTYEGFTQMQWSTF